MRKILLILLCLFTLQMTLYSETTEGTAAAADESFFASANDKRVGATNLFPVGTIVKVTNLENGRSVEVRVAQRLDSPGISILLSKEASVFIGANGSTPVEIQPLYNDSGRNWDSMASTSATPPQITRNPVPTTSSPSATGSERPTPSATTPGATTTTANSIPEEGGIEVYTSPKAPAPSPPVREESSTQFVFSPDSPKPPEPITGNSAVGSPSHIPDGTSTGDLLEFADRGAKGSIYASPSTEPEPEPEPVEEERAISVVPDTEPVTEAVVITDSAESIPDKAVSEEKKGDNKISVTITREQPQEVTPQYEIRPYYQPVERRADLVPDQLLVNTLQRGAVYLQIGAFNDSRIIDDHYNRLSIDFPIAFWQVDLGYGKTAYRFLVGPLNPDESGLAYYQLKAMGYSDAFIRTP